MPGTAAITNDPIVFENRPETSPPAMRNLDFVVLSEEGSEEEQKSPRQEPDDMIKNFFNNQR